MKKAVVKFSSEAGVSKSRMSLSRMFVLAILAGFYLTFGATASTIGSCMIENPSVAKIVSGLLFSPGLCFVIINGAELFTGNNLIIISVLDKKVEAFEMLRNWIVVYIGNFVGSVVISAIAVYGNAFACFEGQPGAAALSTAAAKCSIAFGPALMKGILCNFLVCTAVMMAFSIDSAGTKFICAILPVTLFVLCGFEHSIANMGYVSTGLFLKAAGLGAEGADAVSIAGFALRNLIPVTLGNIIGGCGAGVIYWYSYIRKTD